MLLAEAPKRPIHPAAAYPASLPAAPKTSPSGFDLDDSTLLYAGTIGLPYQKSPVGWLPQMRERVNGSFDDALAAARAMAKRRLDPSAFTPPGQSTKTTLAAVIQAQDGAYHVAPVFVQSFDDEMRRSAFGTSMWRSDEFMPGKNTTVVALAGPKSWIDARPGAPTVPDSLPGIASAAVRG